MSDMLYAKKYCMYGRVRTFAPLSLYEYLPQYQLILELIALLSKSCFLSSLPPPPPLLLLKVLLTFSALMDARTYEHAVFVFPPLPPPSPF